MVQCKTGVQVFVINDQYNPIKTHVFKIYRDYHVYYNQGINGKLFYNRFERISRGKGYYGVLSQFKRVYKNINLKKFGIN